MATMLRHLRGPLIAFTAIFAASLTVRPSVGLLDDGAGEDGLRDGLRMLLVRDKPGPGDPGGHGRAAALRPTSTACETAPGGGCSCRSPEPAAPSPKPARSTAEGRTESGHTAAFTLLDEDHAARIAPSSQLPLTQGPPKVPLYLRNERLLF